MIIPTITRSISPIVSFAASAVLQEPLLPSDGTGSSLDPWDRLRQLQAENQALKSEKQALEHQLSQLNSEMQNMKISCEGPENSKDQPQEELSEEAARKRLERLCKRNSQGILGSILFLCGDVNFLQQKKYVDLC